MNKRMLSLLIGLVVIAVLLVVNGCVFVVKSIEIKYETPTNLSEEEQQEFDRNIIEKSGLSIGKNMFIIRESVVTKNIEKNVKDVEVVSIERYINKIVLYVAVRTPIMAVPIATGIDETKYVIVDSMMKVLSVVDGTPEELEGLAIVENTPLTGGSVVVGETLSTAYGNVVYQLQNVAVSFQYAGLAPKEFSKFITRIRVTATEMTLVTNEGVSLLVDLKDKNNVVLTTEDIKHRVKRAYEWYLDVGITVSGGYATYDAAQDAYTWNSSI